MTLEHSKCYILFKASQSPFIGNCSLWIGDLTFLTFLFKTMTKNWFKYDAAVYEKEERYYMTPTSSFFNEFVFSWQKIATAMYPMGG